MSYLVVLAFIVILGSLAFALYYMLRGSDSNADKSQRMARALAMRVGFSIALFASLLLAWKMGWIQPTGIPPGR